MASSPQADAPPAPTLSTAAERRVAARLRWRCRRGLKELDLMLEAWLTWHYPQASAARRTAFAALLDLADSELARYLLLGEPPEDRRLRAMVEELRRTREPEAGRPGADPNPLGGGVMSDPTARNHPSEGSVP